MTVKELMEKISKIKPVHKQNPNKSLYLALNRSNKITKIANGKYALVEN